ncbi:putative MFS family arabinose efflux permease [Acinetobacter calcoaceticus]|uniref:Putative MFS family arabinose efflux permease n=1 Tax=Acinetobacter calcoaceticus TaxID=471 RepID=A0A4R1XST6_ACICA|nr:putative MFS family arabinose efflux permease [Acinetobacter calcoaceticus]
MDTQIKKKVISAVIGNTLEWYDFLIYGFLATTIAKLFFPEKNELTSLLLALGTFGVGFLMRPVGGILIGYYADKHGRKAALLLIISVMTLAVAMIAFAPTAASIGVAAPILIVIARLLQGFATGGEYASSTAFVIEAAPLDKKGLYGSWQFFGQCLAVLFGSAIAAAVNEFLTPAMLESWGWRIPFIIGLLICPVGLWIRSHLDENDEYLNSRAASTNSRATIQHTVRSSWKEIGLSMGLTISATGSFYVVLVNTPTFAHTKLGLQMGDVLFIQALAVSMMMIVIPLAGLWSDYVGRKPVLYTGLLILLLTALPLYQFVIEAPSLGRLLTMQLVLCFGIAMMFGPSPAAISEQFPVLGRTTSMSIAYNMAVMLFGGFAPFIVTWLISIFDRTAPAYYLSLTILIGILSVIKMKETSPKMLKLKRKYNPASQ